jgi:hypothetical protein
MAHPAPKPESSPKVVAMRHSSGKSHSSLYDDSSLLRVHGYKTAPPSEPDKGVEGLPNHGRLAAKMVGQPMPAA